ncbi:MAG: hypothetical protein WC729_25580 [Sphingomonas sp.]|jgi:hypothetical protein|uniref:hypothetical protein n=1 Tax=Sphingomonas sp. TaxID=28214 RepID=UPI0035631150
MRLRSTNTYIILLNINKISTDWDALGMAEKDSVSARCDPGMPRERTGHTRHRQAAKSCDKNVRAGYRLISADIRQEAKRFRCRI